MPRENKQRGRRGDKKRKREDEESIAHSPLKKQKSPDSADENEEISILADDDAGNDFIPFDEKPDVDETPFLGLLTEEDQAYYSNVNNKIVANDFESEEDRLNFIDAVYRESIGKELRIASSQSSSRYLEKIIMMSNKVQLVMLFEKFLGNLTGLVQHRFASHCCEAIFRKAASTLDTELRTSGPSKENSGLERLFQQSVKELEPNLGFLLTERFASHVLRVLIVILAGEPLEDATYGSVLASRKKENIGAVDSAPDAGVNQTRRVPKSFKQALSEMISGATSTLETTYLRALATHPTGNPVLQLLLKLEMTLTDKATPKDPKSVLRRLLPDEGLEDDSESGKFIVGLVYDPTGSRLVETIVQYAPGKVFKRLYKNIFKARMGSMAKNDIAGYVVVKLLERLSKEDLEFAKLQILPEIPALVARYRVNVIQVLVERCNVRDLGIEDLVITLQEAYGTVGHRLPKMLKLDAAPDKISDIDNVSQRRTTDTRIVQAVDLHGSLLAQALLKSQDTCSLVQDDLLAMPVELLRLLAKDPIASRIVQTALTEEASSSQFRRKLVPKFYDHMAELAIDTAGSHLADALWTGSDGSHFQKERLAKELQASETILRDSRYGRTVWKNWSMDMYQSQFRDWQALAKGLGAAQDTDVSTLKKSAIDIARERFVKRKAESSQPHQRQTAVTASG